MTDAELERLLALDASPGPALAIDAMYADALIEAVLDGAGFVGGPGGGGSGGGGSAGGGGGAAAGSAGVKLALGIAAFLAAVAVVLFLARRGRGGEQEAVVQPPDAALPDAATGGGSGLAVAPPVPDPVPAPVDAAEPAIEPEIEIAPEPARPERPAKPAPSAADLLGEANAKRLAKQWREADALYAKVVERASKGLAAQSALISSATIRLEHLGDAKGAAQRFRRALAMAPSGALAEDARWGIAEAARAMKDRRAEVAALDDFLAHHAGSPLASRAKARREELR